MLKFKGFVAYKIKLTETLVNLTPPALEAALRENAFTPCRPENRARMGFEPVVKGGELLAFPVCGGYMIRVRRQEKILPASVIRDEVDERKDKFEETTGKQPTRGEARLIKDEVTTDLLLRALSRNTRVYAWLDLAVGRVIVFVGSVTKAETILALLRKALGTLPTTPYNAATPLDLEMTDWLRTKGCPDGISATGEIALTDIHSAAGSIRCSKTEVDADVLSELMQSRIVRSMGLESATHKAAFTLSSDGRVSGLTFDDADDLPADKDGREDANSRFDADAHLFLSSLLPLVDALDFDVKAQNA